VVGWIVTSFLQAVLDIAAGALIVLIFSVFRPAEAYVE